MKKILSLVLTFLILLSAFSMFTFQVEAATIELRYHDNGPEAYITFHVGKGYAVRFTPPKRIKILEIGTRFQAQAGTSPYKIHICDSSRNDLITPITEQTSGGWDWVDVSSYSIYVENDFYVAIEWVEHFTPFIGEDASSPDGRSWTVYFDTGYWFQQSGQDDTWDYMITVRADDLVQEPDLIVEDIWWDPVDPQAGQPFDIHYRIKNQGPGDAVETFQSFLFIDGTDQYYGVNYGLASGATYTWTTENVVLDGGDHTLLAIADANDEVPESNEGNNDRSETCHVSPNDYTVTVDPGGGRVYVDGSPITSSTPYTWPEGSTYQLDPDSGYEPSSGTKLIFNQWSDGNTDDPRSITVSGDVTYTVQWDTQYYVTFQQSGCGDTPHVTVDGGTPQTVPYSTWMDSGSFHSFTYESPVTAGADQWVLTSTSHSSPITVTGPVTITGYYTAVGPERTISLRTATTDGLENINNNFGNTLVFDGGDYNVPDTVSKPDGTYTAQANPPGSYSFHHWEYVDGVSVSDEYANPTQVSVGGNGELTAVFFLDVRVCFSQGEGYFPIKGLDFDHDGLINQNAHIVDTNPELYQLEDIDNDDGRVNGYKLDAPAYIYSKEYGSYRIIEYWLYYAKDNKEFFGLSCGHEHDFESIYLWVDSDHIIRNASLNHHLWKNNYNSTSLSIFGSPPKAIWVAVEESGHAMILMRPVSHTFIKPDNSITIPDTPVFPFKWQYDANKIAVLYPWKIYDGINPTDDGFGNADLLRTGINYDLCVTPTNWFKVGNAIIGMASVAKNGEEAFISAAWKNSILLAFFSDMSRSIHEFVLLASDQPFGLSLLDQQVIALYLEAPWLRKDFVNAEELFERPGFSEIISKWTLKAIACVISIFAPPIVSFFIATPLSVAADLLFDPVNSTIIDPSGNIVGLRDGEWVNEIPGVVALWRDSEFEVFLALGDSRSLKYEVQTSETTSYTLSFGAMYNDNSTASFNATEVSLSPSGVHRFEIDWDMLKAGQNGTTVSVDCDGDGTFDQTWQTGTTLTADQMMRAHNLDTGFGYATIQEAINAPETLAGHIIKVRAGIYYENVVLSKSLVLIGENIGTTIIDGNGTGSCFKITANNVHIEGFVIRNSGATFPEAGVEVYGENVSIVENEISNCGLYSIFVYNSGGIVIQRNNITDSASAGIYLLDMNFGNTIVENRIINSNRGIVFDNSANNYVIGNIIANNSDVGIWGGAYNIFYHNNFLNNSDHVRIPSHENNTWDDGYPSGGNYWSGYAGVDANMDGIGESSYELDSNNIDHYPLMGVFSDFLTTLEEQTYHVTTVCNSTISAFQFDQVNRIIRFNVTGEESTGFCRICIPHDLIEPPYTVTIDGHPPQYIDYTIYDNGTHRWIYFTYQHSTHEVIIAQTPTSVGGTSIPVNKLELLAPYIGLTILLAVAVITVGYVKKRKRDTEINS